MHSESQLPSVDQTGRHTPSTVEIVAKAQVAWLLKLANNVAYHLGDDATATPGRVDQPGLRRSCRSKRQARTSADRNP